MMASPEEVALFVALTAAMISPRPPSANGTPGVAHFATTDVLGRERGAAVPSLAALTDRSAELRRREQIAQNELARLRPGTQSREAIHFGFATTSTLRA